MDDEGNIEASKKRSSTKSPYCFISRILEPSSQSHVLDLSCIGGITSGGGGMSYESELMSRVVQRLLFGNDWGGASKVCAVNSLREAKTT